MRSRTDRVRLTHIVAFAWWGLLTAAPAEDVTFFSYSDSHYGAER